MDKEILEAIQATNENLNRLAALIAIGVIIWILKSIAVMSNHIMGVMKQQWREYARSLYEKGKNEKLVVESEKKISKEPKNPEGYYWKATAERELGRNENLQKTVTQLLEISPSWKEDWMIASVLDNSPKEPDHT